MKLLFQITLILITLPGTAQKTITEAFAYCEQQSDSILMSYAGTEAFATCFKIDSSWTHIWQPFVHRCRPCPSEILVDSIGCVTRYHFATGEFYHTGFLEIITHYPSGVNTDSTFLRELRQRSGITFISDSVIADIAGKKLGLKDTGFIVKYYFENNADVIQSFTYHKTGRYYTEEPVAPNRLLIKIGEPEKTIRYIDTHTRKVISGKYVIVDAYTGEMVDRGGRRKRTRGQYYWIYEKDKYRRIY